MQSKALTVDQYMKDLPEERKAPMQKLRNTIKEHMDPQLEEGMNYGMIGFYVPHSVYPGGYHCNPKDPLPFMNLASQKNYISVYHMGLYMKDSNEWFVNAYKEEMGKKPDMGKCCIRFKKIDQIPYDLIGKLTERISVNDWIQYYENTLQNSSKSKSK